MSQQNSELKMGANDATDEGDDGDSSYGELTDHELETLIALEQRSEQKSIRKSNRSISPPPTKRTKIETSRPSLPITDQQSGSKGMQISAEPVTTKDPNEQGISIVKMYRKQDQTLYSFKYSAEMELEMITNNPGMFSYSGSKRGPISDDFRHKLDQTAKTALEDIEPNSGGFVSVKYRDPEDKKAEVENADIQQAATQCIPNSNNLCRFCQKVVNESTVLNRHWRNSRARDSSEEDMKERTPVQEVQAADYTGPKVNVFGHHGLLGALKRSAKAGCHLCSLLNAFDPKTPFTYDEASRTPYVLKVIYAVNHDEGPGVLVLQATGFPTKASYLYFGEPTRHIAPTLKHPRTDSIEIIELAKQWLHDCLTTHLTCNARSADSPAFIPTRLIKVNALERNVQSIHVVLGADLPAKTKYLTLSHCWGGANIVKLLQSTLARFQSEIPLSLLPKNFSHAVLITHLLGYEYIWIDSLCIIQDSADDWRYEAALMGSVYRHSVCTIAAVGAKDSYGGCFFDRSALSFTPCQLVPKSQSRPGVYALNWQSQPEPLHTRAWVVQERCLSVRTLNFGLEQVFWDCISANAYENKPEMEETVYDMSLKRRFYDLLDSSMEDPQSRNHTHWSGNWWEMLRRYTKCNISFATDKWPAMKGMATEIETATKQKLVHGLWSNNLADELLWTTSSPKKQRLDIGAPSWSWLSVEGEIHRRRYNYTKYYRIDASVALSTPVTSSATSLLDDSEEPKVLDINSRLIRITWVMSAPKEDAVPSYNFRFRDGRPPPAPRSRPTWDGRWTADTTPDENWETWALHIVRSNDDFEISGCAGLIVVPVVETENTYRRVGFYEILWRDENGVGEKKWGVRNGERWFGDWNSIKLV